MISEPSLSEPTENAENTPINQKLIDLAGAIVNKMRLTASKEDTLKTAVEILYGTLKCDRVVIYTLEPSPSGKVAAEAVTPGFAQILGTVIDDPYFQAEYIEKYQKGRAKATNDIYAEKINPFYLKNLEKIEVKANIILPLVHVDGSLYGLLMAHQCSQPREWQQSEINLMLQIADWVTANLDRQIGYQTLQNKLDDINKWQDSLAEITQKIYAETNTSDILQTTLETVKNVLQCDRVVIYSLQEPTFGQITAEATIPALASILGRTIEDPCFKHRYIEKYKEGRVRAIDDIYQAGMTGCYIEKLESIAVKSNLVAPITSDDGEIHGLLVVHQCFSFREWQKREIWWLKQVAIQTGFSLSKAKLAEKSTSISSDQKNLANARDIITITRSQLKEIQTPIQIISQNLLETINLNRLLAREVNLINQSGSAQDKKEKNLIHIISKKLYSNILDLKKSFDLLNDRNQEMDRLLEDATTDLYPGEAEHYTDSVD